MKAIVFRGIGDIRLEDMPDPVIQQPMDAIVRLTASAICGTDLHMVRGTLGPMEPGTILGHEGVGVVEALGTGVRNINEGDRVVIASSIACGYCSYCRAGYHSQCDNANPNGKLAGTAFFGGPKESGPFPGLQAEMARVPFANVGLVKLPDDITNKMAICLSDVFPTGYFGGKLAEIRAGDTVAIFGCGPVGLFAIISAKLMDAGRIIAVDQWPARLGMARSLGAEVVDFSKEEPVETILDLTGGIGVDRIVDAVGVDAEHPVRGPAADHLKDKMEKLESDVDKVAPKHQKQGQEWRPGNAPAMALNWEVQSLAKAGTLGIVGVYPETLESFPIGAAMSKNITIKMGNCNHRHYIPRLLELVQEGVADPSGIVTQVVPLQNGVDAYRKFNQRAPEWTKVEIVPGVSHPEQKGERRARQKEEIAMPA